MTVDELKEHLKRFSYKGKYHLSLEPTKLTLLGFPSDTYMLSLRLWCEDSERKMGPNWVNQTLQLFVEDIWRMDLELLKQRVFNLVSDLEHHEVMEWLRYDNEHVRDPHPEVKHGRKDRKP